MRSPATRSAALLCAAVGLVACSSHSSKPRGAPTPVEAVTTFVIAINAGSASAAEAISCPDFRDQAHQAATSGADPGIAFSAKSVQVGATSATAQLVETLDVSGQTKTMAYTLTLTEKSGRWLVCGRT